MQLLKLYMKKSFWTLVISLTILIAIITLIIHFKPLQLSLNSVVFAVTLGAPLAGIFFGVNEIWKGYKRESGRNAFVEEVKKRVISTFLTFRPEISRIKKVKIKYAQEEDQIVKEFLSLVFREQKTNYINSLILIYFCKKYENSNDPDLSDLNQIKGYSNILKIGKGGDDLKMFHSLYKSVFTSENSKDLDEFQRTFVNRFLTEQAFSYITEELNQSKNFVSTLRKIIKEGKLSAYGVKQESIAQIENELRANTSLHHIFLVVGQHIAKETSIRKFLETLPKLGGVQWLKKIPYSTHLVKISDSVSSNDLLTEIKKHYENDDETIIWIIPIDTTSIEEFVFPADRSFRNNYIKRSYEIFNDFINVTDISDSSIVWSIIKRSKVTIRQLLTVIPFNIFCPGITPSESDFIISNYEAIKTKLDVNSLTDFGRESPEEIARTLVDIGVPRYGKDETDSLGLSLPVKEREVYQRYLVLAQDIVTNSVAYAKAVEGYE